MKKVLLLYGTRYGSTAEISEAIKDIIIENDIEVEMVNLAETKLKNLPSIEQFHGILIGSSIRIGKMTKDVRKFLKKYTDILKSEANLVGIFISCMTANNPDDRPKARKEYIEDELSEYGIKADMYEAFGGALDLTDDSNIGSIQKKIMTAAAKDDPNLTAGEKNDHRNWEFIKNFANEFCNLVNK
ncbi:MAG: hypothetical protein EU543_04110 [Promethearchaeota archaeon]|nr:MAG: hypothetical protein EU543_04110 [Candidatus Lokiarchaeota archaeon]